MKARQKDRPTICIPMIFELSTHKLTKSTLSHRFTRRGTLPCSPPGLYKMCSCALPLLRIHSDGIRKITNTLLDRVIKSETKLMWSYEDTYFQMLVSLTIGKSLSNISNTV